MSVVLLVALMGATGFPDASGSGPQTQEIIVTGRRDDQRFRLPPEFRPQPLDVGGNWRGSVEQAFSCNKAGENACPLRPDRILTVRSDGKVQWGEPKR